jgi:hypothetical protein
LLSPFGIIVAVRRSSLFSVALHQRVRLSDACTLRRSRSSAQLNVGKRRASKGFTERYEGFMAFALNADHSRNRLDSAVPDRANIVRLSISNRRKSRARRRPGHRYGSSCRLSVRSSQASGRPASPRHSIDRLVSCGSARAFLLPQRWWHDAPLSRVALHQKVALGVPPVKVSHDQCQRCMLQYDRGRRAGARKSRPATKSSRR